MLCGPSDVVFKKPAILSFQHCAALKQGQWSLSVYYSDSAPEDPPNWQVKQKWKFSITASRSDGLA